MDLALDPLLALMAPATLAFCVAVALAGGVVKGMVGFAMPLIMISGLGSVIAPDLALAGVILPTLLSNLWQALRQGAGAALGSLRAFRIFLISGAVMLALSAQFVRVIPSATMFVLIGVPIVAFTSLQLLGWRPRIAPSARRRVELMAGLAAGAMGGFSGTWGPPTVLFLTALDTPKVDQVRIQGVLYALGSVVLLLAHLGSGVIRAETLPFALAMCVPCLAGMWLGLRLQDRTPQHLFQRATLLVLTFAGLNLIRRGILG